MPWNLGLSLLNLFLNVYYCVVHKWHSIYSINISLAVLWKQVNTVISNYSLNWKNKLITRDHHQYEPHLVQIHETSKIIHSLLILTALLLPWKRNKKLTSNKNCSELKINLTYNQNLIQSISLTRTERIS